MHQSKGRWLGEEGGLGLTGGARFGRKRLQMGGTPATNSVVLGVSWAERRKGGTRGHPGGFTGGLLLGEGARVFARGRDRTTKGMSCSPGSLARARRRPWHAGQACQREKGGGAYPFGVLPGWASGRKEVWDEMVPDGLFSIFLFLFSFLFSDFWIVSYIL
jgi:hypothetical protein